MKKFLSLTLCIILAVAVLPVAQAAEYGDFEYQANSVGTYVITGYNNYKNDYVAIPDTINGIKVTAVGKGAFQNKSNITTVKFPETLTAIASSAFYGCKNLSSVILSDSVTSIGSKAFSMCTSLTGINLKNVTTVGEHAFYGCNSLTNLYCGNALKVIGAYAFQKCTSLSFIKQASTLIYIGNYAFADCTSLTSLTLPNSLSYIGNSAFKNCTALKTLKFGTGSLEIGAYAFENCSSLTALTIPNTVTSIGRYAFALRSSGTTSFSHNITLTCEKKNGAGTKYAKIHNVPVYVGEYNKTYSCFGDLNGNGKTDKNDAKAVLRIAASMDPAISGEKLFICDINCNGKLDTEDVSYLLKNC